MSKTRRIGSLTRKRQIATILARHGLGWLAFDLGLGDLIPFHRGWLGHPQRETPYTRPEHVRMALAELGVVYIKLGQVLSTRPDMLPAAYINELSLLQDAAPTAPFAEIAAVIEAELGAPPATIFRLFDPVPRASASIGQTHAAVLADGTPVIVKIQRPGVEQIVDADLAVLVELAHLAEERTKLGESYDLEDWVADFSYTLRNELDYTREAHNAERIRKNFANEPVLHVPKIYWEYTTQRVLCMEELRGIKVNDLAGLDAAGLDRRRIAQNSVRLMLIEVFEHGFFHGDPHPGNFFVMPGEVIGLIDFGIVGRLDDALRDTLLRIVLALIQQNSDRLVDEMIAVGIASGRVQRHALKRDLDHFMARYRDLSLREWAASETLNEVMSIALRHRLQLPSDLILLAKVMSMSEGLGAQLDPDFQLLEYAEPYLHRFWLQNRAPDRLARRIGQDVMDLANLSLGLPIRLQRLLGQFERGEVTLTTRHEGLSDALMQLNRIANRVAMSVLMAALIIGLALLMLIYHPAGWESWGGAVFGAAFVVVTIFGLGLLWSIWRSNQ